MACLKEDGKSFINPLCNPRWKLEVEDLHIIRQATKRTEDRMLAQDVRQKIASWLWSFHG